MLAGNIIEIYIVKSEETDKWIINSCISGFEVPFKISFYYYITYSLLQTYSVEKIFSSFYNAWSSSLASIWETCIHWDKNFIFRKIMD